MATQKKKKAPSHALFWSLIKETPGYEEAYKDVIKEGLVNQYSGGRTCSLSEMYRKYPAEYSNMLEAMKGDTDQRQARYEEARDKAAKRVIAAICGWISWDISLKHVTIKSATLYQWPAGQQTARILMQYRKAN